MIIQSIHRAGRVILGPLFISLFLSTAPAQVVPAPESSPPANTPESPALRRPLGDMPRALQDPPDVRLKNLLVPMLVKHHQPAIAACVFNDQSVLATAVIGVRMRGDEHSARLTDRWHLGSVTKSITSTMIGTLIEAGMLKWETTLEQALPDAAKTMNEKYKKVTLRDLLRHRAGLPSFTDGASPDFALAKGQTGDAAKQRRDFVTKLLALEPALEPGSKIFYSNASYAVAAAIAERVTGKPWETLLQDRVFAPLKLESAGFGWPASPDRSDEPRGHMAGPLGSKPEPLDPAYKLPLTLAPAGDVHMSISDFATYAQSHLNGLRGNPGLLKPQTIEALHEPIGDYAAGWVVDKLDDNRRDWHNGSAGTFFALVTLIRDQNMGVVVVTNSGDGAKACEEITRSALEVFAAR